MSAFSPCHLNECSLCAPPLPVEHSFLPGTVAGLCEIMVAAAWRLKVSLQGGVRTVVAHTLSGSWEVSGPGSLDLRMMVGALFEVAAERQRGARA